MRRFDTRILNNRRGGLVEVDGVLNFRDPDKLIPLQTRRGAQRYGNAAPVDQGDQLSDDMRRVVALERDNRPRRYAMAVEQRLIIPCRPPQPIVGKGAGAVMQKRTVRVFLKDCVQPG